MVAQNLSAADYARLKQLIVELVEQRGPAKTICPSEVARAYTNINWRDLMPVVRQLAAELVAEGSIVVTQKGQPVDLTQARGPIRLRLKQ